MYLKILPAAILLLALLACKNKTPHPQHAEQPSPDSAVAAGSYLPVRDFILGDVRLVDSFAGAILRKTDLAGRKDSGYVSPQQFREKINAFLPEVLDSARFARTFEEVSLMDETTRLLNFIYTARDTAETLRKVVVYIVPSLTIDQVETIYMEKAFRDQGQSVQQKLTWKMHQSCSILTIRYTGPETSVVTQEKLIWDPFHFAD
ncbi:MAG: hypothetical protein P0Y53_02930 [Candidatus Pseudobacter hemicellulosilyticus]|uniref:Lipoprotein n=1 Tax=Candidatus Pseudobacter hemicellulosilyticus TaxID=3121375 RepID=A0AAJ5WTT1_9BACT|nr:MAG: hypothetical protein P0Y53_02930 [Pseudobacter sp.]